MTTYYPFWGHTPKNKFVVDKSCLSHWFPCKIPFRFSNQFKDVKNSLILDLPTAEHALMLSKAVMFKDLKIALQIIKSETPGEAKRLGRQVKDFDVNVWSERSYGIALLINLLKFTYNSSLGDFLLGIQEDIFVEASPYDHIWGIGMSVNDPNWLDKSLWGENRLGKVLTEVRRHLQNTNCTAMQKIFLDTLFNCLYAS